MSREELTSAAEILDIIEGRPSANEAMPPARDLLSL
jgi:hypothetical protein